MKKAFAVALVLLGITFVGGGAYAVDRGVDAKDQVRAELGRQNITTPDDAAIANAPVRSAATAKAMAMAMAMADIIDVHARETTGGLSYGEMGRFMTKDRSPAGTNIESEAVRGADGQPVRNPLRSVAFEASANRTGLYTSVMAFSVSDLVVGPRRHDAGPRVRLCGRRDRPGRPYRSRPGSPQAASGPPGVVRNRRDWNDARTPEAPEPAEPAEPTLSAAPRSAQ